MSVKDTKPTSVRLPEQLLKILKLEAKHQKRSVSKEIEYILEVYFNNQFSDT